MPSDAKSEEFTNETKRLDELISKAENSMDLVEVKKNISEYGEIIKNSKFKKDYLKGESEHTPERIEETVSNRITEVIANQVFSNYERENQKKSSKRHRGTRITPLKFYADFKKMIELYKEAVDPLIDTYKEIISPLDDRLKIMGMSKDSIFKDVIRLKNPEFIANNSRELKKLEKGFSESPNYTVFTAIDMIMLVNENILALKGYDPDYPKEELDKMEELVSGASYRFASKIINDINAYTVDAKSGHLENVSEDRSMLDKGIRYFIRQIENNSKDKEKSDKQIKELTEGQEKVKSEYEDFIRTRNSGIIKAYSEELKKLEETFSVAPNAVMNRVVYILDSFNKIEKIAKEEDCPKEELDKIISNSGYTFAKKIIESLDSYTKNHEARELANNKVITGYSSLDKAIDYCVKQIKNKSKAEEAGEIEEKQKKIKVAFDKKIHTEYDTLDKEEDKFYADLEAAAKSGDKEKYDAACGKYLAFCIDYGLILNTTPEQMKKEFSEFDAMYTKAAGQNGGNKEADNQTDNQTDIETGVVREPEKVKVAYKPTGQNEGGNPTQMIDIPILKRKRVDDTPYRLLRPEK